MAAPKSTSNTITGSYTTPTTGFLSYLPKAWIAYAELMRLNKPIGTLNIFFPYLFGSLFAACITHNTSDPNSVLATNAYLFVMAFILRSAGCVWNDLNDHDLDAKVARCRVRPVARGAVSPRQACAFYAALMAIWIVMLSRTNGETVQYAFATLVLGHYYPFAKRHTDYPQVMLGLALSAGVPVGCAFQGVSPTALVKEHHSAAVGLAFLCSSYFMWTVIHDVVYGLQDKQDDVKAGVKSMCLRYEGHIITLLVVLAMAQIFSQIATGVAIQAGFLYYFGSCLSTTVLLGVLIMKVDVEDPKACLWWFQFECCAIGLTIAAGLTGEYLARRMMSG